MLRIVFLGLLAILALASVAQCQEDSSSTEINTNQEASKKLLVQELSDYDAELNNRLYDYFAKKTGHQGQKRKRSDIDARLLELQAKIMLNKAVPKEKPTAGHGRFNFTKIGKRSKSAQTSDDSKFYSSAFYSKLEKMLSKEADESSETK